MAKYSSYKITNYENIDVGENTRPKSRRDVANNTTKEFSVGDFVCVKLSQLYSQVRKKVKQGDTKYIVVNVQDKGKAS